MTSLVIPTWNRARLLERSLSHNAQFTQPDEVIVVDDGSTDDTRDVCERFGVTYIPTGRTGEASCSLARNIGLRAASGDEVIVTDPEVMFVTDVVAAMREARVSDPGSILHPATARKERRYAGSERADHGWFYLVCLRRSWVLDVGGWDEAFPEAWGWEDIDLYERLRALGHELAPVGCEVLHQWHPSRTTDAPGNEAVVRERQRLRDEGRGGIVVNT